MNDFIIKVKNQLFEYYNTLAAVFPQIVLGIVILILTFFIAHQLKRLTNRRVKKKAKDPLLASFIGQFIRFIVITFGLVIVLGIIGLGDAASKILAGAGITAFIIGFAFKDIGENFLAGILMAFKRPFSIGDIIETNAVKGKIIGLNLRETIVKTFDGKDVYIPNGIIIKNPLFNLTIDGFLRQEFIIGIEFDNRISEAFKLLEETVSKIDGVLIDEKKPLVLLDDLGTSSIILIVQFWIDTFNTTNSAAKIKSEVMHACITALAKNNFYMPGNVMELKNYKETNLTTSAKSIEK
ncbi:MAG: mechanosensitive ion channel [Bacteroidetes bacterium]|nr:mechanosensitive ion channel [Bacteroidota bacterium]